LPTFVRAASGRRRRDGLIGSAITGRGEVVKSGGRVMKNVTGYDLVKFLAGSYGTLAVLSEVTFKVLPAPETEATLVIDGLDDVRHCRALGTQNPSGHRRPMPLYQRRPGAPASAWKACRLSRRPRRALRWMPGPSTAPLLDGEASAELWRTIRDVEVLAAPAGVPVWRLSVKPGDAPALVETLHRAFECRALYDWGGGLVWIAGGEGWDAGAETIRAAIAAVGGHATLVRAAHDVRNAVDVFQPLPEPLMALSRKLKESFDPAGILNPGRIYPGV
jgi:glycolate oxidase FAD binding subunit